MRHLMRGAFGHRTTATAMYVHAGSAARLRHRAWFLLVLLALVGWSVGAAEGVTPAVTFAGPALPFADNPDPSQCGIPQALGPGVLGEVDGHYQGVLVAPQVYLYDSHRRQAVRGTLPTGSRVTVVLYQSNPTLDFYLVRADTPTGVLEGWVPGPFLRILTDDEASAARVK